MIYLKILKSAEKHLKHWLVYYSQPITIAVFPFFFVLAVISADNQALTIKIEKPTDCAICLDPLFEQNSIHDTVTLSCSTQHSYHFGCIHECYKTKPECPLCRSPLISTNLSGERLFDYTLQKRTNIVGATSLIGQLLQDKQADDPELFTEKCSLCKNNLLHSAHQNQSDVITLACNPSHSYHMQCLLKESKMKNECPDCTESLLSSAENKTERIFNFKLEKQTTTEEDLINSYRWVCSLLWCFPQRIQHED